MITFKCTIGVIFFSLSVFVTLLNFVIFIPVFRLAFIEKKSTVYIIAFFNIISDLIQIFTAGLWFSASMIADRYLFTGALITPASTTIAGVFYGAWYMECCVQMLMAVNRFTVVTLNKHHIFTFKNTLIIFLFVTPITMFSALCNQYLFPCCQFILDQQLMTIYFVDHDGLYSYSHSLHLFYSITCSGVAIVCYATIFVTIRKAPKISAATTSRRSTQTNQEIKYVLQFVLVLIFYIGAWGFYELLPFIVPEGHPEVYALVPMCVNVNCSTCAIIYLAMNSDIQKAVQVPWLRKVFASKASSQVAASSGVQIH